MTEQISNNSEIRTDLVDTAIGFLKNSKVAKESIEKKRAFLQQKSLTENEIDYAFKLVPQQETNQQLVPNHRPSFLRRLFYDLILAGLISFAIKIFKRWFRSKQSIKSADLNETIANLQKTIQDMQTSVTKLEQTADQLHLTINSTTTNSSAFEDLKREIQVLKGLFLGRSQFPSIPSRPPSIPAWQLQTAEKLKDRPSTTTESTNLVASENEKKSDEDNHLSISPSSDSSNDS